MATWDTQHHHVDIEAELTTITDCAPPGEEARGGEIQGSRGPRRQPDKTKSNQSIFLSSRMLLKYY